MRRLTLAAALLVLAGAALPANASTLDDPLHGYCAGIGQCIDNGTSSPTIINPPSNFGFTVSPGPAFGSTFLIDVLVPNNEAKPASFALTGTLAGTATLFSATPWTSGFLDAYLGISASPNNPIGAFIIPAGNTGFKVYQAMLGPITLQGPSNPNVSPLENITSGILPQGSYIVAFLNEGTASSPDWVATANSGAIREIGSPTTVPVPPAAWLFGTALVGLGVLGRRGRKDRLTRGRKR